MPTTLEELAAALHTAADESAQTNKVLNEEVLPQLKELKATVVQAGLNGHTALLKKFLDEYAAGQSKEQAWATVRADVRGWAVIRWLASPRAWLKALLYAAIGGLGWKIVSGLSLPHLPFQ